MHSKIVKFEAGCPFTGSLSLLHTRQSVRWYEQISLLSELTDLPMQTVMEDLEDIQAYLRSYRGDLPDSTGGISGTDLVTVSPRE